MTSRLQQEIRQTRPFRSLGHEASVAMLRTAELIRTHLGQLLSEHGITLPQYNVLRILRGAEPDGLCINEVSERLIERNPGITRMIDRLERNGWVRRERQADDRRVILCLLTPAGRRLVNKLDKPVEAADDEVIAGLSNTEAQRLLKSLEKIREQLG